MSSTIREIHEDLFQDVKKLLKLFCVAISQIKSFLKESNIACNQTVPVLWGVENAEQKPSSDIAQYNPSRISYHCYFGDVIAASKFKNLHPFNTHLLSRNQNIAHNQIVPLFWSVKDF